MGGCGQEWVTGGEPMWEVFLPAREWKTKQEHVLESEGVRTGSNEGRVRGLGEGRGG